MQEGAANELAGRKRIGLIQALPGGLPRARLSFHVKVTRGIGELSPISMSAERTMMQADPRKSGLFDFRRS